MRSKLREAVIVGNPQHIVAEHVLERVPFIFNNDWATYRSWRRELGTRLGIDPREISLIGSACVGFSLSPYKDLRPFDKDSDVDVAIVSEWHFSEAWHALRNIDATFGQLTPIQKSALEAHKNNYVYWGCIATDRILALLPFAARWLEGLSHMASISPTEHHSPRILRSVAIALNRIVAQHTVGSRPKK